MISILYYTWKLSMGNASSHHETKLWDNAINFHRKYYISSSMTIHFPSWFERKISLLFPFFLPQNCLKKINIYISKSGINVWLLFVLWGMNFTLIVVVSLSKPAYTWVAFQNSICKSFVWNLDLKLSKTQYYKWCLGS